MSRLTDRSDETFGFGPGSRPSTDHYSPGSTRTAIAQATGLGRSTVLQRLEALFDSGLIVETDEREASGGRPSKVLRLNHLAGLVGAVDIGEERTRIIVTDLGRRVVADHVEQLALSDGPTAILDHIAQTIRKLVADADHAAGSLVGIGFGLPAPVDYLAGKVVGWSIMSGWDGFDIRGHLGEVLEVPILIDNDVNLLTLAEHRRYWPNEQHLLYVKAGTGIGSGQIVGGRINRGAQGAAGRHRTRSHLRIRRPIVSLVKPAGAFEALAGGWALARDLRERSGVEIHDARGVVDLVQKGDTHALAGLRAAGRTLGEALAYATSLLNPSVIVVGGMLSSAGDHLIAGVRQLIYQHSLPLATRDMQIVPTKFRSRAGIAGAAYLVLDHVLDPMTIDEAIAGRIPSFFANVSSRSLE